MNAPLHPQTKAVSHGDALRAAGELVTRIEKRMVPMPDGKRISSGAKGDHERALDVLEYLTHNRAPK